MATEQEVSLRLRLGSFELDYEGPTGFLSEAIPDLLASVSALSKSAPEAEEIEGEVVEDDDSETPNMTTSSIAAKIGAASGGELILAAATRLTLVLKKETFSRSDLLGEIKSATAYFKESYSKNLTSYINALVKDHKLIESSKNTYALPAQVRTDLRSRLGS